MFRENSLTLSPKKVQVEVIEEVSSIFAGFSASAARCSQDPTKMQAIRDFNTPNNQTKLKS